MKFRLAEFCLAAATVVNAATRDDPFLRGRLLQSLFDKVPICHYNSVLGKFTKISVRKSRLQNHIGVHGPVGGLKDMTVEIANRIEGSEDCTCVPPYTGDGLNCKMKAAPAPKVQLCHYDAGLGKFKKISVKRFRLPQYVNIYGPPVGYKDMKVVDANKIVGSRDCTCVPGYTGDGVNCAIKSPIGPPKAVCTNVSLTADGRCEAAVLASEIGKGSSDPGNQMLSYTLSPSGLYYGYYGPGDNKVTLTVTAGGERSSQCQAIVKVVDTEKPSITCPDNINTTGTLTGGVCTKQVTWANPLARRDNCENLLPTISVQRTIGMERDSQFPEGSTTVAYKATDAAGNSNECSFVVAVYCEAPPPLPKAVCNNVTLKADNNCQAAAVASDIGMGSSDPRNEALSYSLNPPGPFRPGDNSVNLTVTATSTSGGKRTSECKANVKVVDEVIPSITCHPDITAKVTGSFCSMLVSYEIPLAKDNCAVNSTVLTAGKGSGGEFEVGKTIESYKVTDKAGLTAECKFTVTIDHQVGVNSQCIEKYTECVYDSDCGSPSRYRCDENNLCSLRDCNDKRDQCCVDKHCAADERCISNVCVKKGKPSFTLKWFGDDDLDLHVLTPSGTEIYYKNDWDGVSGGQLEKDVTNVTGNASRVENIYFPMVGAPTGNYTFWVEYHEPVRGPEDYKLAAYLDETMVRSDSGTLTKENNSSERFIYKLI